MTDHFTLGIEEEFQLVDGQSGELCSSIESALEKCTPYFEEQLKPEMLQSTIEFVSDVLPDIATARSELSAARSLLSRLLAEEGLALISAGTHPGAFWMEQEVTQRERYQDLVAEYQDVARSILIFGMHVHVAVPSNDVAVTVMNQARTWLPHLLAFSSNSPFWYGRLTGLKSYRTVAWKSFPRSGMPDVFHSRQHFDSYVQKLVDMECIDNAKKIWWDMRPHPFFGTVEFRICDMPATIEDTLSLAALCQALVAKLVWLGKHEQDVPVLARDYIEENKWRAMRYGLDAEVIDFVRPRRLSMRDAIRELLAFVDDVVDDLGSRREIDHIHAVLDGPAGTGADRQIAVFEETGDVGKVQRHLIEQTMQGILPEAVLAAPPQFIFRMSRRMS